MKKIIVDKVTYWYNTRMFELYKDFKGKVKVKVESFNQAQLNQIIEQLNYQKNGNN